MSSPLPKWLEPLTHLEDFNGDAKKYIDHLFSLFERDFIKANPAFKGKKVFCNLSDDGGKPKAFNHVTTQEDRESGERILDLRRCERIGWIKSIIEHCTDPAILTWEQPHYTPERTTNRIYLFLECDNFLVILEEIKRRDHFMITAIYVDNPKQKKKHLAAYTKHRKT